MRKLFLATLSLNALAATAFAADLPSRKEAPVYVAPSPSASWTGFYVGADIGAAFGSTSTENFSSTRSSNAGGVLGGGYIGYNYQVSPNFVLGVEGDFQGVSGNSSATSANPYYHATIENRQEWLAAINGRLGVAYGQALFYAIGGGAWTQDKFSLNGAVVGVGALSQTFPFAAGRSVDVFGFDVGGGVEYAFNQNWVGRVEYRYYDFGPYSLQPVYSDRERTSINTVRVGLAYLFGAPAPVVAKY